MQQAMPDVLASEACLQVGGPRDTVLVDISIVDDPCLQEYFLIGSWFFALCQKRFLHIRFLYFHVLEASWFGFVAASCAALGATSFH